MDRMMVLQFVVLGGGFMMEMMGGQIWYLVFLVGFKMSFDLAIHIKLYAPIVAE